MITSTALAGRLFPVILRDQWKKASMCTLSTASFFNEEEWHYDAKGPARSLRK